MSLFVIVAVACGCGGSERVAMAPRATPSVGLPSVTPPSPEPIPEPKPTSEPAGCGTVLAAGILFGDRLPNGDFDGQTPAIFRLEDDQWQRAALPAIVGGNVLHSLGGVSFSGDGRVWAWAGGGESAIHALRSIDDGRTWQDASSTLPAMVRAGGLHVLDLWFQTETSGWLATANFFIVGQATVYITHDMGGSWEELRSVGGLLGTGWGRFATRADGVEIALSGSGTNVVRFDEHVTEVVSEDSGRDYTTWDRRGWIAGSSFTPSGERPVVYSATLGQEWRPQPLPLDGAGSLHAIDFSDATAGITCGRAATQNGPEPLCFWTTNGGASWHESEMPQFDVPMQIFDVVGCPGRTAWAVAEEFGSDSRVAFLRSGDGGASWTEVPVVGVRSGRIRSLARDGGR